jgi:hypothetical protein
MRSPVRSRSGPPNFHSTRQAALSTRREKTLRRSARLVRPVATYYTRELVYDLQARDELQAKIPPSSAIPPRDVVALFGKMDRVRVRVLEARDELDRIEAWVATRQWVRIGELRRHFRQQGAAQTSRRLRLASREHRSLQAQRPVHTAAATW